MVLSMCTTTSLAQGSVDMRVQHMDRISVSPIQIGPAEKRFAPRRRNTIPALIHFDGSSLTVPCLIRDMSTTGAKLELRTGWDNPFSSAASDMESIRLVIRADRVMYECRIVRRDAAELGVKFTAPPRPIAKIVR